MEFENVIAKLEEIYDILYYSLGIAELGIAGVVLLYGIIAGLIATILGMLISLVVYVFQAIPLFKISKKMGRKAAWLVWLFWVPFIGGYFSTYVLADIPGDKPVKLLGNFMIKSRKMSFWIHLGIYLFGTPLITALIALISIFPVIGQIIGTISTLLYLVPFVAVAWIEYAYLRDVLDLFKPNKKANNTAAIVLAVLDSLVTFGLARAFYLYTVMNKNPLPKEIQEEEGSVCK